MTREEMEMRKLVRESDVIDKTDGTELARAFNHLWNKYIEQQPVFDKIRAEIKALSPEPTAYDVVDGNPIKDAVWETIADVLKIIDKYKAESEDKNEKDMPIFN